MSYINYGWVQPGAGGMQKRKVFRKLETFYLCIINKLHKYNSTFPYHVKGKGRPPQKETCSRAH